MTEVSPPSTPAEAATRLDQLKQDPAWSQSFLQGQPAPMKEYQGLQSLISKGDNVDLAMSGQMMGNEKTGFMNTPEHIEMMGAASMLREAGVRDEIVRDVLAGTHTVTKEEFAQVKQLKLDKMANKEWSQRLLGGDREATREFALMNLVLNGNVSDGKAA